MANSPCEHTSHLLNMMNRHVTADVRTDPSETYGRQPSFIRLVTEPSVKTSLIAFAMSGAIDRTVRQSISTAGSIGSVLVTMTSLNADRLSRSAAGPDSTCLLYTSDAADE